MNAEVKWFREAGGYLHPSPQWAIDQFGFEENAMGDFGSNTADESRKRLEIFRAYLLRELLMDRKRWPNELQIKHSDRIAKSKLRYGWSKILFKLKITKRRLYRTQHGMTRDPYNWYFIMITDMGLDDRPDLWITPVKNRIPKYLRRRGMMAWISYLETDDLKYFRKYERIAMWQLRLPRREFALTQARHRARTVGSSRVLELIEKLTPIPNKGYEKEES